MKPDVEQLSRLTRHQGSIYALCAGKNDEEFFSGGSEGVVARWNLNELKEAVGVAKVSGQIFSLLFLAEKNQLVIGTMSGGLHVIDLNEKKEIHYITYHEDSIFDIKEHDGKIFVASKDGMLTVWNNESFQLERMMVVSDQSLRMIDFHPAKNEAALGCSDSRIYLADLKNFKIISALEGPSNSVFSLCYLNEKTLLAGSRDAQLYVYDLGENKLKVQIKAHLYTINHIVPILDGRFIATASRDKTIRIWDAENFELIKSLDREKYDGHINSVNRLLWIAEKNLLVSASDDRSVIVWKITD
ncbi:MAG: WD40 repeat domain-containing protein [Chitinophagales bacterium]